jgi:hypothetical protein
MSKLSQQASVWTPETMLQRFVRCRAMLHVHGYLSQAESDKVQRRIVKAAKCEVAAEKTTPTKRTRKSVARS